MFNQKDLEFLKLKNIEPAVLKEHRNYLIEENFFVNLLKPATINDGIQKLSKLEIEKYQEIFEIRKNNYKITKFVPASGAASRMFQFLTVFLNEFNKEQESINAYINRKKDNLLQTFIIGIEKFPFYNEINNQLKHQNILSEDDYIYQFIKILIGNEFLNYSEKPKGILPFHKIDDNYSTPVDKHLEEAFLYTLTNKKANIHFTVSKDYENEFKILTEKFLQKNNLKNDINYSFSFQDVSTDTIAWTKNFEPYKNNNTLITRPSGHGALLYNLNQLDANFVFIKNIDNVLHHTSQEMITYKKVLAGILIEIQEKIFNYIIQIEQFYSKELEQEVINFMYESINRTIDEDFDFFTDENKKKYLIEQLNRPIRVCGMVKNEGEPGGGPFWIIDQKGKKSLQIIETAQINSKSEKQIKILKNATHFNPVDLVCSLKNYQNKTFNLQDFVDNSMGFMVKKSKDGTTILAYELPGLWNGSMAKWHTIFVEVPIDTFNPVKTVVDLLKPANQRKLQ
jgi:Domain of unknown function (DUF4301)